MFVLVAAISLAPQVHRTLFVGPGRAFSRIEEAIASAKAGDTVDVYPSRDHYARTAVRLRLENVALKGMGSEPVIIDGDGFDYSGIGSIPRAIFQFDPESSGSSLSNFELRDAHNESFNGAGIRINQASRVTIDRCNIHSNDMGIMSGGDAGDPHSGEYQLISHCRIHENGNPKDPGYNHNLYLGGTSVRVEFCDIYGALTGHNLKSRAHFTMVSYCKIHDSANRELDFVEAWDTERANSNAVLIGNVIAKDPKCRGNRGTLHFGREKGVRNGSLFLINNTIVTPFLTGVVGLSTPQGSVRLIKNVIVNTYQVGPSIMDVTDGATLGQVSGEGNWIGRGYDLSQFGDRLTKTATGSRREESPLDSKLRVRQADIAGVPPSYLDGEGKRVYFSPEFRYDGIGWKPTKASFIGAG